jgi:ABC-type transport system involved in multi-copper enzyme maturation permease subunit
MNTILALAVVVIKELYRRKDFYVLFVMTAVITLLMAAAMLFKDEKITGVLKEICFLLIWISGLVIAVATAARQIPAERENRTIFPLLAKPVTRAQIVAGKFLGCWVASGVALVIFYVFLGVVIASLEHALPLRNYFEAIWMQWMFLAMVIAGALWGSLIFPAQSSNVTVCLVVVTLLVLLGRQLSGLAIDQSEPLCTLIYAGYFLIPHFEWFNLKDYVIANAGTAGGVFCLLASLYAAAYAGFFLLGAWLSFRRRALTA